MTDLQKPDLSKDTSGPFVTRDGRKAEYVGPSLGHPVYPYAFNVVDAGYVTVQADGAIFRNRRPNDLDIFLAPKEPKTVFVNWYANGRTSDAHPAVADANVLNMGRLALLQLEVDDQGVPVHNSVVRRIEG